MPEPLWSASDASSFPDRRRHGPRDSRLARLPKRRVQADHESRPPGRMQHRDQLRATCDWIAIHSEDVPIGDQAPQVEVPRMWTRMSDPFDLQPERKSWGYLKLLQIVLQRSLFGRESRFETIGTDDASIPPQTRPFSCALSTPTTCPIFSTLR